MSRVCAHCGEVYQGEDRLVCPHCGADADLTYAEEPNEFEFEGAEEAPPTPAGKGCFGALLLGALLWAALEALR